MKCYSTVHLTTRLLRHEPGRREAAAYHFGLPADKPLMSQLIVMLSANLGVMNLLPIPALDGGRFLFLIVEAIRGKPINREKEGLVNFIGFALLMVLMVFILFNDVSNLFS